MINIIVAVSENNIIGKDNDLIWHLPKDLKRFKQLTTGHPIIMGRKTFESFGKPLPNRPHFVISKNPKPNTEQIFWFTNLEDALAEAQKLDDEVFVIGGGTIYNLALPFADKLYITFVHDIYEGDTSFVDIDYDQWKLVKNETVRADDKHSVDFTFAEFERINLEE